MLNFFYCLSSIFVLGFALFGVESFEPEGRQGHASIIVGNKIYYFGGDLGGNSYSREVFYLDLSQQFDATSPRWNLLSSTIPFKNAWATAALDNTNNASIYLFGGMMFDKSSNQPIISSTSGSILHKFDVNSLTWEVTYSNSAPKNRMEMKAVSDNSGKFYVYGGDTNQVLGSQIEYTFSELVSFNFINSQWSTYTADNSIGRAKYSATLLSNGFIVYIGGIEADNIRNAVVTADIIKIIRFDTKSSTWSTKIANIKGSTPIQNRVRHTSVLAPNGQVVVYGGTQTPQTLPGSEFARATPDIFVLNTETEPYEFSIPTISTSIGISPSLAGHTADVLGDYMIVAFGNVTVQNSNPSRVMNKNIYLMDLRNYTWVNSYTQTKINTQPSSTLPTSQPTSQPDSNDVSRILTPIFGVLGSFIVAISGVIAYRWIKKRKEDNIGIPGTVIDDKPVRGSFLHKFSKKVKKNDDVGFPGTAVDPDYVRSYQV